MYKAYLYFGKNVVIMNISQIVWCCTVPLSMSTSRLHLAEQITVRIVQIMIQATDLAQILYGGHFSRKNCGPRKISIWPPFSKMAAMGYCEMLFLASKMALNDEKRLFWQKSVYFEQSNCTLNVTNTIQMFRSFQYGRQFPRWPPSAIV